MGHANVYIRKDNEKYWEALPDKSAWVNERLEQSFDHEQKPEPKPADDWESPMPRRKDKL